MISDEKKYEFLTSQIAVRDQKAVDTYFKSFAQLYSAILGGSIWLGMQNHIKPEAAASYVWLSDVLVAILVLIFAGLVIDNYRAWWGYRKALSDLAGTNESGEYADLLPSSFQLP